MEEQALRNVWLMFKREHGCSIDRMVCDPRLREAFLASASCIVRCDNEHEILWSLLRLRKNRTLTPSKQR